MHTFAALLALSCCLKSQLYSSFKMQCLWRQCQSFTLRSSNIWTSSMSTLSGVCSSRCTPFLLCLHWAAVMTSSTTAMARCDVDGVNGKSSHHIQPLQQCWITGQHMKQAKQHILCHGRDDLLNVHWWCALMLDSVWTHFSLCCICHQNFDQTDIFLQYHHRHASQAVCCFWNSAACWHLETPWTEYNSLRTAASGYLTCLCKAKGSLGPTWNYLKLLFIERLAASSFPIFSAELLDSTWSMLSNT